MRSGRVRAERHDNEMDLRYLRTVVDDAHRDEFAAGLEKEDKRRARTSKLSRNAPDEAFDGTNEPCLAPASKRA